jgi:DNA-directed RNA polymerase beta' subunit
MKYISQIQFGLMTPEEIERISVCEINSSKNDLDTYNTVYDPRMGPMKHGQICPTCSHPSKDCMGHFGHINLNVRIIHPMYSRTVVSFLKCFCMNCYRLIFTEEMLELWGYLRYSSDQRFDLVVKRADKDRCCQRCHTILPKYTYSNNLNEYYAIYKKPARRIILKVEDIDRVLSSILDDDISLLGLNSTCFHPRSLILQKLPVIPPRSRPFVLVDGMMNDDDLTIQYIEIIKANEYLSNQELSLVKREKYAQTIRFKIMTLMDNSGNKSKHSSNHAIKSIKERISGKEGRIRGSLMGKRCLAYGTPVLLWSGKRKMIEDIEIGDTLVGDDGLPRKVTDTTRGYDKMYKVKQVVGEDYVVNSQHILSLRCTDHLIVTPSRGRHQLKWINNGRVQCKEFNTLDDVDKFKKVIPKSNILDIPLPDYLNLPKSQTRRMYGFKLNTPIDWDYKPVELDPYILGMWLGDGNTAFTTLDKELLDYWTEWSHKNNMTVTKIHGSDSLKANGNHHMTKALRHYNLINNKHIPQDYLLNDAKTRLKLLAGLIDMDGSVEQDGIRITSQCHRIIEGAMFLAQSLGFRCTLKERKKYSTALTLNISGYIESIPTLLPRKKCRNTTYDEPRYGIQVEEFGEGKFAGVTVDGNNRFLLGDFTVVHNCNFTARTVIGPDPTLKIDEIAIPHKIADILTYTEQVNRYNIEAIQKLKRDNQIHVIIRGDCRFRLKYMTKDIPIKIGDQVERQLQDGDYVLLNRQPTLHKGSMLAHKIIRRPGKTIRLNLAVTGSFNADFDGDEMNIHTASSECSRAELEMLVSTKQNIIGCKNAKPIISIVQDGVLGIYKMTKVDRSLPEDVFNDICCNTNFKISDILRRAPNKTTYELFSLMLPEDFHYKRGDVLIRSGMLLKGPITKADIGSSQKSIIRYLEKEYPIHVVYDFLNNIQFIANHYLLFCGFSIGIADCIPKNTGEINRVISECFIEAHGYEQTTRNPGIKEMRVTMALNKAKDVGLRLAKDSLDDDNNFLDTIQSGSKGSFFNIAQITGLLGQQNVTGSRVPQQLNRGKRTLPHFLDDNSFESRGFIKSSFLKGLSPTEFWFHAMTAREGVLDTSLKTASSGYLQRKCVKIMEDIRVEHDYSVRNSKNNVVQFCYGDNLDPHKMVGDSFINVRRAADRLKPIQ